MAVRSSIPYFNAYARPATPPTGRPLFATFQPTQPQAMPMQALSTQQAIEALPGAATMPPEIKQALLLLGQIKHLPADEAYIRYLGVDPIFKSGDEALRLILNKGLRVEFGDMGNSKAHAQWIAEKQLIMINQKYRGQLTKDILYAISEAIYHEAGHAARQGDNQASIQEETNCLAMNTLANRFHAATDPQYAHSASHSRLIADGVALYSKLFFDPDPNKTALVDRIILKYGELPPESPDHTIPKPVTGLTAPTPLTDKVVRKIQHDRIMKQWYA